MISPKYFVAKSQPIEHNRMNKKIRTTSTDAGRRMNCITLYFKCQTIFEIRAEFHHRFSRNIFSIRLSTCMWHPNIARICSARFREQNNLLFVYSWDNYNYLFVLTYMIEHCNTKWRSSRKIALKTKTRQNNFNVLLINHAT